MKRFTAVTSVCRVCVCIDIIEADYVPFNEFKFGRRSSSESEKSILQSYLVVYLSWSVAEVAHREELTNPDVWLFRFNDNYRILF